VSRAEGAGQAERVRQFYDRNAARFERLGQGGASMHRAVWGPGVTSREAAFHHVEDLILQALPPGTGRPRVVDLGCGVGASLLHLASRADLTGEGLTISPAQAARAEQLVAAAGLAGRVHCRVGDFLTPPADLAGPDRAGADLVYSIEAFVHGPDPAGYFRAAAGLLRPGGRLVLVDDVLTGSEDRLTGRDARLVERFRRGWRVGSLLTPDRLRELAGDAGLVPVEDRDLTAQLELRRPRDRWITLMLALGRPLHAVRPPGEYWRSLDGGDALQHALVRSLLAYRFLVLERPGAGPGPDGPASAIR
jgi:cyclopropane fatty-acyl-phospholipid synthase-like methyltransferase